jgi:uncharacterized protein
LQCHHGLCYHALNGMPGDALPVHQATTAEANDMRRSHVTGIILLATLTTVATACERDDNGDAYRSPITFDTAYARVITATDTFRLAVEIAERDDQRSHGLMERTELPDDAGMVFLYDAEQPPDAGFWMYRTRIPLDIAFFDEAGVIVAIRTMDPCPYADFGRCPTYEPGVAYHGALEVNRGWFAARGAAPGDRVVVDR